VVNSPDLSDSGAIHLKAPLKLSSCTVTSFETETRFADDCTRQLMVPCFDSPTHSQQSLLLRSITKISNEWREIASQENLYSITGYQYNY
jgi:hypothetical protein